MKLNKLLKWLLAFALPTYITDGDGGGGALSTDSFAEMLGTPDEPDQPETESIDDEAAQETEQEAAPDDAEQSEDPAPDEQPEKDSPEAFLELEINGEKVSVSKDEAKAGYLRQADYTTKTQSLAVERQNVQAHLVQQFQQVQQMSNEIGQLTNIDASLSQYQQVDWAALRETDPLSYSTHLAEYNDLRNRRGEVVQGIGHKQQAMAQMQQQQFAQQTQEAQEHLAKVIPGFGKEHLSQMKEFGIKHGFQPAELANVADKRMLEVLYKASQYDAMQAKAQQAVKKVAALPTKANKAAPASAPAAQLNIDKQAKRVQQTGSVRDFAALLSMSPRK